MCKHSTCEERCAGCINGTHTLSLLYTLRPQRQPTSRCGMGSMECSYKKLLPLTPYPLPPPHAALRGPSTHQCCWAGDVVVHRAPNRAPVAWGAWYQGTGRPCRSDRGLVSRRINSRVGTGNGTHLTVRIFTNTQRKVTQASPRSCPQCIKLHRAYCEP